MPPRVLLTNDDGIDSPGLRGLAERLVEHVDLVVAAPIDDWSGCGTGIGRFSSVTGVETERTDDVHGVPAWVVDGPPGLAVTAAMLGALGPRPDLVVAGVDAGMNTGHAAIHSGTLGAVLTARTFHGRGCAISLARGDPWQWETAISIGTSVVEWMLADPVSPDALNVNVPSVPLPLVRGAAWAGLDDFGHVHVAARMNPTMPVQVALSDAPQDPRDRDDDTSLCQRDWITLTPIASIMARPFPQRSPNEIASAGIRDPMSDGGLWRASSPFGPDEEHE